MILPVDSQWYYQWNIRGKIFAGFTSGGITSGISVTLPVEYQWYYQWNIRGITNGIPVEYQWYYLRNISDFDFV